MYLRVKYSNADRSSACRGVNTGGGWVGVVCVRACMLVAFVCVFSRCFVFFGTIFGLVWFGLSVAFDLSRVETIKHRACVSSMFQRRCC